MADILLLEPAYKNKYPPLGLMKLAYYHRNVRGDYVRFAKGRLPEAYQGKRWDRVYVTSMFTFEWAETVRTIKYALEVVKEKQNVFVGGIAATLMPDKILEETGVTPITGLLNRQGLLGYEDSDIIDTMTPDYSILDDIKNQYVYTNHDAYFLYATKGCGMRCGFCAVQTLEPEYVPYIDIKTKIEQISSRFGSKKDLLLIDNNVLRSECFDQIIDDIKAAGFSKGATYTNPKTGKTVNRYVDFNQGLDANLLNEHKARRLGEIALKPARIAFDHVEDQQKYERAIRLCVKHGVTTLSNYILYNSETFTGKGTTYAADTPEDLYQRMRFTVDLQDSINNETTSRKPFSIFSFPMRYIPLADRQRGYIGSNWSKKYLRAVQCMLIPTQGKGMVSRKFFLAAFGLDVDDYMEILAMPESLIVARGHFVENKKNESESERTERLRIWQQNREQWIEWQRLFRMLGEEKDEFLSNINRPLVPEVLLGLKSHLQQKLFLHYLTDNRVLQLLGGFDQKSPTAAGIKGYITEEFPVFYQQLVEMLAGSKTANTAAHLAFYRFFGHDGFRDLMYHIWLSSEDKDGRLKSLAHVFRKEPNLYHYLQMSRLYLRYCAVDILSEGQRKEAMCAFLSLDTETMRLVLGKSSAALTEHVVSQLQDSMGQHLLANTVYELISQVRGLLGEVI